LDKYYFHSNDFVAFGTDYDEKFFGWNSYKDVHKIQFNALKNFKFLTSNVRINFQGDVAWITDTPVWEIETKKGKKIKSEVRLTAVLKRDRANNRWLIVQWHVSIGLGQKLHGY